MIGMFWSDKVKDEIKKKVTEEFNSTGLEKFLDDDINFINKYYSKVECNFIENGLFIYYDGDVILSCSTLRDEAKFIINYLYTSIEEIQGIRKKHYICQIINLSKQY